MNINNMNYNELYAEYGKILEENSKLKAENQEYRRRLGLLNDNLSLNENDGCGENENAYAGMLNNNSTPHEKINFFMSLFVGRDDVYAESWVNKNDQKDGKKPGYSPACLNKFKQGCYIKKTGCAGCSIKKYKAVSPAVISRHLKGKAVYGIYPLLTDDTCHFLAMDFDGSGWQEEVSVIRGICAENKLPMAVERSRSGNGGHIWLFFKDRVKAALARKFGSALLTLAMVKRHDITFKAYDRLFPGQDTMPKGGLGNLIAFPLQKEARKYNNSVFVDENFQAYDDQWSYLSGVKKLTGSEILLFIKNMGGGDELGELRPNEDNDAEEAPWENKRKKIVLSKEDFPEVVHITKANMLYISKQGFSHRALNALKRIAAFKNPEFYKKQKMRMSVYNIPRIISSSEESPDYLGLPRGCETELIDFFDSYKQEVTWDDKVNAGKFINVDFNGQLNTEQALSAEAMLMHDNGILSAATAFGKTIIGISLISARKTNTLIIVFTQNLLEQWIDRLKQFLIIREELPEELPETTATSSEVRGRGKKKKRELIGQIKANKNTLSGIIDVAIIKSLIKDDEVKELVRDYGMVIVDECHNVAANTYEKVIKYVNAKYVYGLTATPARADGRQPIIFMQCGPERYKVDARKQAEKRPFSHYIVPRFTAFKKPVSQDEKEWHIADVYNALSISEIRNQLIVEDVVRCATEGRNSIILTERIEHVNILAEVIKERIPDVISLTGSMSRGERTGAMEALKAIPAERNITLIATGKLLGEGFDEPRLDTLFLAMPISWKGKLNQYAGRLHRLHDNKKEVIVFDYIDIHVEILERMYKKRLRGYFAIGYKVKSDYQAMEVANAIFSNHNFVDVFYNDLLAAKNEIIIFSPFISDYRLNQMIKPLYSRLYEGIKITVVTRPDDSYEESMHLSVKSMIDMLINTGVNVILKTNIHQKFAIIDQKIVWYGSINLLSYGKSEESIMRLDNVNIAHELTETINSE